MIQERLAAGLRAAVLTAMVALTFGATAAAAQTQPAGAAGASGNMTREQLREALATHEEVAESPDYSRELRQQAQLEAAMIRRRLEEGDFGVGDQLQINVPGYPDMSDTYTVSAGQIITIPNIGEIDVGGVLRSEIESHLQTELGRFLRDPVVRAQPTIRLSISGAIGSPGFYTFPSTALLSDVIMQAGGPTGDARLEGTHIERRGEVLWEDEVVEEALASGRTLDQLNLRAGDQIQVPGEGDTFWSGVRLWLPIVTSLSWLAWRLFD